MSTVYSLHTLALKPGVNPQVFERFFASELAPIYGRVAGSACALLRGNRGQRQEHYLVMLAIESVERRDYLFPVDAQWPPEVQQLLEETAPAWQKLDAFVIQFRDPQPTDYVVVER